MRAYQWVQQEGVPSPLPDDVYCSHRDVFQTRLDRMISLLLSSTVVSENQAYLISAIAGEIGNNSFDHNLGNWRDIQGVFFHHDFASQPRIIILADRGQGVFTTLQPVKPELQNDQEAIETAFTEALSGRAPEKRGNGLKFVRQVIHDQQLHLLFSSGLAQAEINDKLRIHPIDKYVYGCLAVLTF